MPTRPAATNLPALAQFATTAHDISRLNRWRPGLSVRLVTLSGLALSLSVSAHAGGFAGFGPRTEYQAPTTAPNWNNGNWLAAGDINADGHVDILVRGIQNIAIFLNDGAGGLLDPVYLASVTSEFPFRVADLNGDGLPDIAAVTSSGSDSSLLSVWLNQGGGAFSPRTDYDTQGVSANHLAVGDLNANGHQDIVVANRNSNTVAVFLNDGAGSFVLSELLDLPPNTTTPWVVAIGDINGNGFNDIAVGHAQSPSNVRQVSFYLNDGLGGFTQSGSRTLPGSTALPDMLLADVDLDGRVDLIVANNTVNVSLNNGAGAFSPVAAYVAVNFPRQLALADVDGDGYPDIAVGNTGSSGSTFATAVLLNDGAGGYGAPLLFSNAGSGTRFSPSVVFADLDGNATPDLISTSRTQTSPLLTFLNTRLNLTDPLPPGEFTLLSPPDGVVGLPLPETVMAWPGANNTAPVTWSRASGFVNTYTLTIALDPGLSMVVHKQSGLTGTRTEIPAGVLMPGVRYYWGVTASNPAGMTYSSPGSHSFGTICAADINGSGVIDFADLNAVLTNFGNACPD